jgi:hypothetical protein
MNHEPRDAWTWVLGQLGLPVSPIENFEHTNRHVFLAGNLPFSLFLFNPFAGPFRGMMQHICVCWVQDLHIHCRYTVEPYLEIQNGAYGVSTGRDSGSFLVFGGMVPGLRWWQLRH